MPRFRLTVLVLVIATLAAAPALAAPGAVFRDCATCPEMVVVPSGTFTMGSPAGEERWSGYDGREDGQRHGRVHAR